MMFSFPYRFAKWLEGEDVTSFIKTYYGKRHFKKISAVWNRTITGEEWTITVYHLYKRSMDGRWDLLDTLFIASDEDYPKIMKAWEEEE